MFAVGGLPTERSPHGTPCDRRCSCQNRNTCPVVCLWMLASPPVLSPEVLEKRSSRACPMYGEFPGSYIRDPSVPKISVTDEWLPGIKARLPEMSAHKVARFMAH